MQILFEEGYEFGKNNGLNLVSGKIKKLDDYNNKILPFVGYQKVLFNIKTKAQNFLKISIMKNFILFILIMQMKLILMKY